MTLWKCCQQHINSTENKSLCCVCVHTLYEVPKCYTPASPPHPSSLTWKHWQPRPLGHQTSARSGFACLGCCSLLPPVEDSIKKTASRKHILSGTGKLLFQTHQIHKLMVKMSNWEWNHKGKSPVLLSEQSRPLNALGQKTGKRVTASNDHWFQLSSQGKRNPLLPLFVILKKLIPVLTNSPQ